jgi:unsaturated chondroitin disaccharide hydrolase
MGLALACKYTQHARYLDVATRLALKFILLLDCEVVPHRDFKLPPDAPRIRDSSALAVALCGFVELAKLGGEDSEFLHSVRPMLLRLCQEDYLDVDENFRSLLKRSYGDLVAYSSWGDHFLMEALDRGLHAGETFW